MSYLSHVSGKIMLLKKSCREKWERVEGFVVLVVLVVVGGHTELIRKENT